MKLATFMKQVADRLQMGGNFGTAHVYRSSLNAIIAFHGNGDLAFREVTPEWLKGFEIHLRSRGCSWNTVSTYMRTLRAVYNRAVDCRKAPYMPYLFRSVYTGTKLAAAEMIRGGVVSFSDMYFFCEETAKAVLETGMKANIGRCLVSFDENDTVAGNDRFEDAVKLRENCQNAGDGRIKVDMSVHAEYTNKEKFLREVADYTNENDLGMQVHVSETELEHKECIERHGMTPVEFLARTGILTNRATAAHCVWVTDDDMALLSQLGVTVAHNPVSNLKLASGVAPVEKLISAGINVGLGTDGAASNNRLSVIRELQTAALIHKGVTRRADVIDTWRFFDMATENGAKAQGRDDCGKLEIGKKADICLIDIDELNNIPMFDPYSALAFSVDPKDVRMTVCDGRVLYEDGEYKTIDVEKLRHEAKYTIEHYFD